MRSVVFPAIVVIGLLLAGLFSSTAGPSAAQEASPAASTPTAPADICSPAETANAGLIEVVPAALNEGVVPPHDPEGTGEVLFLVAMTMPPETCYAWRELNGAVMLLVQEGTIEYTAQDAGHPDVQIMQGDNDGDATNTVPVALDTAVTLEADEWITQNRRVWFSFRNGGSADAVLSLAYYGENPWPTDPCSGNCRKP